MIHVFGSINIDLVGRVGTLPKPGETIIGRGFETLPGGKGANQALAAVRAGAQVAMSGAVGRDGFAQLALANLAAEGVDLGGVSQVDAATGTALILVEEGGENVIAIFAGANAEARWDRATPIGAGDTLLLQMEVPVAAVAAAAGDAKAKGACVVLSLAPFVMPPADLLAAADFVVVNESEAMLLARHFGLPAGETAPRALHERLGSALVVTRGPKGAIAFAEGRSEIIDAPRVAAVDTVGAGDTFAGVFAATFGGGKGLRHALARAVAAASLACTRPGAQGAMPRADEIDAMLAGA